MKRTKPDFLHLDTEMRTTIPTPPLEQHPIEATNMALASNRRNMRTYQKILHEIKEGNKPSDKLEKNLDLNHEEIHIRAEDVPEEYLNKHKDREKMFPKYYKNKLENEKREKEQLAQAKNNIAKLETEQNKIKKRLKSQKPSTRGKLVRKKKTEALKNSDEPLSSTGFLSSKPEKQSKQKMAQT